MGTRPNLGAFEQLVMLSVLRLTGRGEDAYGMTVRRELAATAGRPVTIGSVYGTLERLQDKGLVTSWHGEPDPVRGGRARRFFRVASDGEAALSDARAIMARMWDGVQLGTESERSV